MIRIQCPKCARQFGLDNSRAGRVSKCPYCLRKLRIPGKPPAKKKVAENPPPPPEPLRVPPPPSEVVFPSFIPTAPPPIPAPAPELEGSFVFEEMPLAPPGSSRKHRSTRDKDKGKSKQRAIPVAPRHPLSEDRPDEILDLVATSAPPALIKRAEEQPTAAPDWDDVEVIDDEPAPLPLRKKKKKKRKKKGSFGGESLILAGGLVLVWILLVGLTFVVRPAIYVIVIIGGVATFTGRRWFLRVAYEEGVGTWLACLLVPFYSAYFFCTHLGDTLKPFLIGVVGYAFLGTAGILWLVHGIRDVAEGRVPVGFGDMADPVGAGRHAAGGGNHAAADRDAEGVELLKGPNKAEALPWLEEPNKRRGIFKWPKEQAITVVKGLFSRGAKQVYVVDISSDARFGELAAQIVVVLPDEPAKRKSLFSWHKEFFVDDAETDVGQKYLLLDLD
jgi:hypothetical protein